MRKRILFVLAVGVMGQPASAARPAASPTSLHVSVDPRVELFSIIYRLAGFLDDGAVGAASHYGMEVENHFGQHRKHPAVGLAIHLKESRKIDYGVALSLAVHVDDAAHLQLRVPLAPWPETLHERWTPALIDEFLAQARDFATQTDFAGFVEAQGPFHAETAARAGDALEAGVQVDWFDRFFGARTGRDFRVFISPLGRRGCFAFWIPSAGGVEAMSVIGVWRLDEQGKPAFRKGALGIDLVSAVVHEFAHSYVNPTAEPYLDRLAEPVERMKPFLVGRFADAYRREEHSALVRESLVRAAVILYLRERWGFLSGRHALSKELRNGAFWMPELLDTLERYEARRDRYPDFQAYMPEVVEFFRAYSSRIRSKSTVARAALPLYAALTGLYALAAWLSSRRWRMPRMTTKWDRVVAFGLVYAVLGPAFEFFALGNRPGLPSLLVGAALLLAATLMVRRSPSGPGETAPLSVLLVLIGAPVFLSARLAWALSAVVVLALLLQARARRVSANVPDGGGPARILP